MNKCVKAQGYEAIVLGGTLKLINRNLWYEDCGYSSFEDMITNGLSHSVSTAHDYMKLYDVLANPEIPWKKIKHLGWTKIKSYGMRRTKSNVDDGLTAVRSTGDEVVHNFAIPEKIA